MYQHCYIPLRNNALTRNGFITTKASRTKWRGKLAIVQGLYVICNPQGYSFTKSYKASLTHYKANVLPYYYSKTR